VSMEVKLKAEKRQERGKELARKLRASGRVPAVLYGKNVESVALSIGAKEAEMLFQSISVENTIIGLEIDGEQAPVQTLIREIQVHSFRPGLLHVDFYRIRQGETLELSIPLNLIGVPDGVRNAGGMLQQALHEVPVRCVPTMIPDSIDIDVTSLEVGGSIHVYDIKPHEGVEIMLEPDQVVCSVFAQRGAETAAGEGEGSE